MSRGACTSSRDEEKRERKRKKKDISNDKVYRGLQTVEIFDIIINRSTIEWKNEFSNRVCIYVCVCVFVARNQREETRNWISNEYFGGGKQESKVTFSRATFL